MTTEEKKIHALWERLIEDIPDEYLFKYIKNHLDFTHDDDIEPPMKEANDWDLVEELKDRNYDFSEEIDVDDAIDICEQNGYKVLEEGIIDNELDTFDSNRLEEIKWKYIYGSWSDREKIYDRIVNG